MVMAEDAKSLFLLAMASNRVHLSLFLHHYEALGSSTDHEICTSDAVVGIFSPASCEFASCFMSSNPDFAEFSSL